ncbi:Ger(x)C family spore germination protein [Bacillus sp. FJAT-29790]|uniref:Ger(x)C family spore germination protein n=1 Tax=Bacillus sp. FJAT-29790 TaxID=1895002 RepID=UPI001C2260F9|nr:Ger(x)C family spore germination protein [Bacillus sp. FJAT-29790]MBU8880070.1 Ger(x)C family spore germination protein [Bacillus sp. FJAT-29790]
MKACKILLSIFIPLFLTGCWDQLELEDHAYVVVMGLDISDDQVINVTFQIANPQVGSTERGAAQNEPPSDIVTITAPDILSAKELANSIISRKLSFAHLRTIIIAEELAKTKLFHHIISSAIIDPELRRETNLIVSKEHAKDFIDANKPKLETRPHKYYAFMLQRWKDTGYVPLSDLNRYFQRLSGELFLAIYATSEKNEKHRENEDSYIAGQVPQKSGDPVQMIGSAVFKNGKMIGTLTGEETRFALLLRHKSLVHSVIESFPDPVNDKYRISVRVKNGETKVKVNTQKVPAEVKVTVPMKVQILSDPSLADYTQDTKKRELLKQSIKETVEAKASELIKKTQKEFKGEPFIWYVEARRHFRTVRDYEKYDWEKKYQEAKVQVHFDLSFESFGEHIKPSVIKNH